MTVFPSLPHTMRPRFSQTATKPVRPARRPRPLRRARRPEKAAPPSPLLEPRIALQRRIRSAGGPEDHALYTCSCGYAFLADVSAGVVCPQCGTQQSW